MPATAGPNTPESETIVSLNSVASTEKTAPPQQPLAAEAATTLREFLAFKLGSEEYGIDILRVQEIRSYEEPTRIANAPPFIKGVVNLRGVIVPIVDITARLLASALSQRG